MRGVKCGSVENRQQLWNYSTMGRWAIYMPDSVRKHFNDSVDCDLEFHPRMKEAICAD